MINKLTVLLLCSLIFFIDINAQSPFYSIVVDSFQNGKKIRFSDFAGKKVLLINVSSGDTSKSQFEEIKQLNELYKDSLIIVAIPSNSFNRASHKEKENAQFYKQDSSNRFPITDCISVRGSDKHSLISWLAEKTKNSVIDTPINGPYQKFLISQQGILIGLFNKNVRPLSPVIIEAIVMRQN